MVTPTVLVVVILVAVAITKDRPLLQLEKLSRQRDEEVEEGGSSNPANRLLPLSCTELLLVSSKRYAK